MPQKTAFISHPNQQVQVNYALCLSCGACAGACPENAIFLSGAHLSFKEGCTSCERCLRSCPAKALALVEIEQNPIL